MILNNRKIAILLSTYNGSPYIGDQIQSIIDQSFGDWTLYIRDDGSNDDTCAIIEAYASKDDRIRFYKDELGNLKTMMSFFSMLENISSDYYMFADQDDVWFREKIEISYNEIKKKEEVVGENYPVLFHCNVTLVNSYLEIIYDSYWYSTKKNPKYVFCYHVQLINPSVLGMTMMFNDALKNRCYPINKYAVMHDAWVTLCAFKYGAVITYLKPLVSYRQHEKNVCGIRYGYKATIGYKLLSIYTILKKNYIHAKRLVLLGEVSYVKYLFIKCYVLFLRYFFFYFVKKNNR